MSEKWYGLSKFGWIFFAVHVILFNILEGHPNIFQFFGGLIGSYILMRVIFGGFEVIQKMRNKDNAQEKELKEPNK